MGVALGDYMRTDLVADTFYAVLEDQGMVPVEKI